jgi:hypothetical protein
MQNAADIKLETCITFTVVKTLVFHDFSYRSSNITVTTGINAAII